MSEQMREEFEGWYLDKFCGGQARLFRCVNADQIYYFTEVQSRWDAWQASRAALVVELPKAYESVPPYACYESGWNDMRGEARDAIEAAGLKVKPCL